MTETAVGTIVKSGTICPASGTWEEKRSGKQKQFKKGDKLPPHNFMAVDWKLVELSG